MEQLKLRNYILQAKAEMEEKRRQENFQIYYAQKEWDLRHLERRQKEICRKAAYVSRKIEPKYSVETKNLSGIKEERVVHNHQLNLLKQRAEQVRGLGAAEVTERKSKARRARQLDVPLGRFERLVRENVELKTKIRSAQIALR